MTDRRRDDEHVVAPIHRHHGDGPLLDRRARPRDGVGIGDVDGLHAAGILRDVDLHAARTIAALAGERDPLAVLGLAMASRAPGAGHVCVDLGAADRVVRMEAAGHAVQWPSADVWRTALAGSPLVACTDAGAPVVDRPIVLDGERLYLARYWRYQQRLLACLRRRAAVVRADVDTAVLREGLERLFASGGHTVPDMQRVAACVAVLRSFAVITGGPGTGKTTTVLRVLALLAEQAIARGTPMPRVMLAAPTGKAAARMSEAIASGIAELPVDPEVAAAIPCAATTTIHRLLRWQFRTPTRFRHDANNPLPADVVIVDEASMVDVALMAKLADAVSDDARLILLGDRDQLASVEAGSILADICGDASNAFSVGFAGTLGAVSGQPVDAARTEPAPVADSITRLVHSHRFRDDGGIGALARAINAGDIDATLDVLRARDPAVTWIEQGAERAIERDVLRIALPHYRTASGRIGDVALRALERFRVLTPHRRGRLGVAGLNATIVSALVDEGTLPREARDRRWFDGQPVLVTENDPQLGLFNGDVGVVLSDGAGGLRAHFRTSDGLRALSPARLPAHETVFAMTVHKAQGSEFDEVLVVLPAEVSPVLTRELLYTAVSRARTHVTIVGSADVLRAGIAERVQRASGLREALWSH